MLRTALKMANARASTIEAMRRISGEQNTSTLEGKRPIRENFVVRLCGEITAHPIKTSNGATYIAMQTINGKDGSFTPHEVFASPAITKSLSVDTHISKGHRVYVIGSVGYKEFRSAKGLSAQQALIATHMIIPSSKSDDDINEVKMYGIVKDKSRIENYAICLDVATTFFATKEQRYKESVHQVMIMTEDQMINQAKTVDIGASLFVHGFLQSERVRNDRGLMRLTQSIRAKKLATVCDFTEHDFEINIY